MCNDKIKVKEIKFLDGIEREFALETFPSGKTLKIDDVSFRIVKNNGVGIYLRPTDEGRVLYGREDREKMTTRFIQGNQILEESLYGDIERHLALPIETLDVSVRLLGILKDADCKTLKDVVSKNEEHFRKLRGFGRLSCIELSNAIATKGFMFDQK